METNQMANDEIEIDLRELGMVLLQKVWIIILSGVVLGVAMLIWTKVTTTPQYQSVTKIYVISQQNESGLTSADFSLSTYLTKDCPEIIKSRTVMENVINALNLDLNYEELREKVSVTASVDTRIVTIAVLDENPAVARDIANALREEATVSIMKIMKMDAVTVVDEANLPEVSLAQGTLKKGILGVFLGCFVAAAVILVKYLIDDTIRVTTDVERYLGLSVLGAIPMDENLTDTKKKHSKKSTKGGKRR